MLKQMIDNLTFEELNAIYNKYWNTNNVKYSAKDIKQHLTVYIIQFYKIRCFKSSCRAKALEIIKDIKKYS